MAGQMGSERASWVVVGIVVLCVAIVSSASEHGRFASNGSHYQQVVAVLSSSDQVSEPRPLSGVMMTSVMGSSSLDLRHAQITDGQEAVVDIFAMMGSVTIRIPDGWTIDARAIPLIGGIRDGRRRSNSVELDTPQTADPPRLVLRGLVMMGSILVKS